MFKGGTSLSKAYDLIDRFSEDIDLSMPRSITDKEKKKSKETIIAIATELGLVLKNPDDVLSRHDYNKYLFESITSQSFVLIRFSQMKVGSYF